MTALRLSYEPEDDFHGELYAFIEVPGFSGRSSAWFNRTDIEEFARQLAVHPLAEAVSISGGYECGDYTDVLLGVSLQRVGHSGIVVNVTLSSEEFGDKLDIRQSASLSFWTDQASLDRFRADLSRMLDDESVEAVLTGE